MDAVMDVVTVIAYELFGGRPRRRWVLDGARVQLQSRKPNEQEWFDQSIVLAEDVIELATGLPKLIVKLSARPQKRLFVGDSGWWLKDGAFRPLSDHWLNSLEAEDLVSLLRKLTDGLTRLDTALYDPVQAVAGE